MTEREWPDAAWQAFNEIAVVGAAYPGAFMPDSIPPTEDDEEPDPPEED